MGSNLESQYENFSLYDQQHLREGAWTTYFGEPTSDERFSNVVQPEVPAGQVLLCLGIQFGKPSGPGVIFRIRDGEERKMSWPADLSPLEKSRNDWQVIFPRPIRFTRAVRVDVFSPRDQLGYMLSLWGVTRPLVRGEK